MTVRVLFCLCLLILASCEPSRRVPAKPARVLTPAVKPSGAHEALAEVNAARAKKGLRPFVKDDGLTAGAMRCAAYRAEHGIKGHVDNGRGFSDFSFLPAGAKASASGAGVGPMDGSWNSCCVDERWTAAGAAWAKGKDNRRYMTLFVR